MYDIAIFWWSAKLYYCGTKEQDEDLNNMEEYFHEMAKMIHQLCTLTNLW